MDTCRNTDYIFQIPFNSRTNSYEPVVIKTRLVNGGVVNLLRALPEGAIAIEEDTGVLDIQTRVLDNEIVITARIRDEVRSRKDFIDLTRGSLKVALQVNRPHEEKSLQQMLLACFWVKVQEATRRERDLKIKPVGFRMPLPADSRKAARIMIQLLKGKDEEPVTLKELSWEKVPAEWESSVTPLKGMTDDIQGVVKFAYTPPDLFFSPQQHFREKITVFSRDGEERHEIDTLELLLSPRVHCRLEAEKKGLVFDPLELKLEPEGRQYIKVISGTLYLPAKDPESGKATKFPVSHAVVTIGYGDGIRCDAIHGKTESDNKGNFRFELPGYPQMPQEKGTEYKLDYEKGEIPQGRLEREMEEAIMRYEEESGMESPRPLFSSVLAKNLRGYRVHYFRQLATKKSDIHESLSCALKLMQITIECTRSFEQTIEAHNSGSKAALGHMLTIISRITETIDLLSRGMEHDANSIGSEISEACKNTDNALYVRRLATSMISPGLRKMTEQFLHSVTEGSERLPSQLVPLTDACKRASDASIQKIESLMEALSGNGAASDSEAGGQGAAFEQVRSVLQIMEHLGAMISAGFMVSFVRTFLESLACFSRMNGSHLEIISPVHKTSLDQFRDLLEIKEKGEDAGDLISRCYSRVVEMMSEKMGEKGRELSYGTGAEEGEKAGNSAQELLDSFDGFRLLAGMITDHIHENARQLRVRKDREAMEMAQSSLISRMKNCTGAPWDSSADPGVPLARLDSFIYYFDWYISMAHTFCTLFGVPSLKEQVHQLDLMQRAFKAYFGVLPRVIADTAGALHLSLIYSISMLNLNSEEDAL